MVRKIKVILDEAEILVEAGQNIKPRKRVAFNSYGNIINYEPKSNSIHIGKSVGSVKAGELCRVRLLKQDKPVEGEIWLNS